MAEWANGGGDELLAGRYKRVRSLTRTPWYRQYVATDTLKGGTVIVKLLALPRGSDEEALQHFQTWYSGHLLGLPGALPVRALHLQDEQLVVVEHLPEGQPWRNWVGQRPADRELLPLIKDLLDRFAAFHERGVYHNCILPENLWWHPQDGWTIADAGWLRWCFLEGYAPAEGNPPEAWTAAVDGHQLGALIAYTLLGISITSADLPLRATIELKQRARKLPHPWPACLTQLWGPPATSLESPMAKARAALDLLPGQALPSDAPPPAPPARATPAPHQPIAGSIAAAAAISATGPSGAGSFAEEARAAFIPQPADESHSEPPQSGTGRRFPTTAPDPRQRRIEATLVTRVIAVSLFLGLFLAIGFLFAMGRYFLQDTTTPVEVPDVTGLTLTAAKRQATADGFEVILTREEYDPEVAAGKILTQTPAPKTTVKALRQIYVTTSRGANTIKLPSMIGLSEESATEGLMNLGLKTGQITYRYAREGAAGKVIDQTPPAGQLMAKEEPVDLVVSRGTLKEELEMPDVTGQAVDRALRTLTRNKLRVRKVVRRYRFDATATIVVFQTPASGASVEQGDDVYLTVEAPKSQEPIGDFQIRLTMTLPTFEGSREVKVLRRDGHGAATVYEETHASGDRLELMIEAYQATRIEIYLDGKLIREEQY